MVSDLKYFDGSLGQDRPRAGRSEALYATAFEVEPQWLVEAAARRQKWIDQAQSLNLYMAGASGKKLDEIYKLAWLRGLKTTYYLRSRSATHVEKSTLKGTDGKLNAVRSRPLTASSSLRLRRSPLPSPGKRAPSTILLRSLPVSGKETRSCSTGPKRTTVRPRNPLNGRRPDPSPAGATGLGASTALARGSRSTTRR